MNELLSHDQKRLKALWPETILVPSVEDAEHMQMSGFENVAALPQVDPNLPRKHFSLALDYLAEPMFQNVKKFILAFPPEGYEAHSEEISRRLGQERCWFVEWPAEVKESYFDKTTLQVCYALLGSEGIKLGISQAKPFPVEGIFSAADAGPNFLSYYENGMPAGEYVGFEHMQDFYSVRPGEWTLVTGMPGHGKSEFVDAMMVNLAGNLEWNFAIFSPENMPFEYHLGKLAEKFTGKPFNKGLTQRMSKDELSIALNWLDKRFTYIMPESLTIDSILSKARALVLLKGIRGLVIDPWNEIDHSRPENLSETEYISKCLTKIRQFAKAHGVHVWLVAHPTKMHKDKVSGEYPVPTPYDVAGSAHFRNKADCCLSVFRDMKSNVVEVHIQKVRFKIVGQLGMVTFDYDRVTGRYKSISSREVA